MRKTKSCCPSALAALALVACALECRADLIAPGTEGKVQPADSKHTSLLYVPRDWKAGQKHPLIFMMHGAGAQPTTWPWRDATEGKTYLIVGLAYGGQDDAGAQGIRSDAGTCTAMMKYINDIRALVDKDYGVDQGQVFLTGLSMGGWGVNFYGFKPEAKGLYRGYCIMAAGPRTDSGVDLSVAKGLPLLLVNGETDPNKRAADEGKPAAEKAGAIVEYTIIPGEGHVPATEKLAAAIAPWLKANGPLKEVKEWIAQAEKLEGEKPGEAIALYEKAGAIASTDPAVEKARARAAELNAAARTELDAAAALADGGKLVEAVPALEAVARKYAGAAVGKEALEKLEALKGSDAFAGAKKTAEAATALEAAEKLATAGKYSEALAALHKIVETWPDTAPAKAAAERLKALEADPKAQLAIAEEKAGSRLKTAKNFVKNGMWDRAKPILEDVVKTYPGTKAADEAKELLAKGR